MSKYKIAPELEKIRLAHGVMSDSYKKQLEKFGFTIDKSKGKSADEMKDALWTLYVNDVLTEHETQRAFARLEKLIKQAAKKEGATDDT